LPDDLQLQLMREMSLLSKVLLGGWPEITKLNTGMIGCVCRQLHCHILGRFENDICWPGPVWGASEAVPYGEAEAKETTGKIEALIRELSSTSNAEEFKTGHEEEVKKKKETPKVGGKCPGLRCFKECVGPNQTLDKGYSTGVGICSNCTKAHNQLAEKRDRSQREKLAEKKWRGKEFNHDAFAKTKKEANPSSSS
jgi:hypothetical protein